MTRLPPLTSEQHKLVLSCVRMAWAYAHRYARIIVNAQPYHTNRPPYQRQLARELFGSAAIGLCEAAQRFDPTRGAKYSTFACWHIRRAIQNDVNRATTQIGANWHGTKRRKHISMFSTLPDNANEHNNLAFDVWDHRASIGEEDRDDDVISNELWTLLMLVLTDRQRQLLIWYAIDGWTFRDIAAAESVSKQRAHQLIAAIIKRLRNNQSFLQAIYRQLARRRAFESYHDFFHTNTGRRIA